MRFATIVTPEGSATQALVKDDELVLLEGDMFGSWEESDATQPFEGTCFLPPVPLPPQIVCIGLNYRDHAAETGKEQPEAPVVFVKTCNTVNAHSAPVALPAMAPDEVDYEAELVVVMGRQAKNVPEEEALDYVFGYTCGNDISARDCQLRQDKQWARGKCFDGFAPMGPWIETELDPRDLRVRSFLNGKVMQDARTSDMLFPVPFLVSYLSRCMTLYPASVIMTGTPAGVGEGRSPKVFLKEGDAVTVEVEGIGRLTNPVMRDAALG